MIRRYQIGSLGDPLPCFVAYLDKESALCTSKLGKMYFAELNKGFTITQSEIVTDRSTIEQIEKRR